MELGAQQAPIALRLEAIENLFESTSPRILAGVEELRAAVGKVKQGKACDSG